MLDRVVPGEQDILAGATKAALDLVKRAGSA